MTGVFLLIAICVGFTSGKIVYKKLNVDKRFSKFVNYGQMTSIIVLLTMMGYKIGSNEQIVASFMTLGLHSILFGLSSMLLSGVMTYFIIKIFNKNAKIDLIPIEDDDDLKEESKGKNAHFMMIAFFLALVFVGGLIGYLRLINITSHFISIIVDWALFAIVFFIGLDMSSSPISISYLKSLGKNVLLISTGVIFGSLLGSLGCGLILGYEPIFSLSIGSGMGWYSLAGIVLSRINDTMGAIAFSANLVRELSAMAMVPIFSVLLGPQSAIAACGATAMDTAMPAITKSLGKEYAIIAFACGAIISSIVPFFLSIIQIIYGII